MDDSRNEDNPGLARWKSDLVGRAVCVWESENEVSQEDGREAVQARIEQLGPGNKVALHHPFFMLLTWKSSHGLVHKVRKIFLKCRIGAGEE